MAVEAIKTPKIECFDALDLSSCKLLEKTWPDRPMEALWLPKFL